MTRNKMTTEELVAYLRQPYVLELAHSPGEVIDQMLEKMKEAADMIEELAILVETIGL